MKEFKPRDKVTQRMTRDGLTLEQAKLQIAELNQKHPESTPDVQIMLSFLEQASPQRGIVR